MFSEISWGDCWHNILFSCAEAEPVLLPVLQARWRSARQRKKCACELHRSAGPWLTPYWSGCRAMFLPALLCAGSALRCTRAQQGLGPSCGSGCQGRRARLSMLFWAHLPLLRAGQGWQLWSRRLLSLAWLCLAGGRGVLMPVLCSHTALVKWVEKSLLILQFSWRAGLNLEFYHWEPLGLSSTVWRIKGSLLKLKFSLVLLTQPQLYQ